MTADDSPWRRPADKPATPGPPPQSPEVPWRPAYSGPPASSPPPPGWRPEVVLQPPAPRSLPPQDHAALDAQERAARTLTQGIGLVAGAVLLVVLCALCARALF